MSRSLDAEKRVKNAEIIRTILMVTLFDRYVSLIQLILIRVCDQWKTIQTKLRKSKSDINIKDNFDVALVKNLLNFVIAVSFRKRLTRHVSHL